jgi:hypothetical protein
MHLRRSTYYRRMMGWNSLSIEHYCGCQLPIANCQIRSDLCLSLSWMRSAAVGWLGAVGIKIRCQCNRRRPTHHYSCIVRNRDEYLNKINPTTFSIPDSSIIMVRVVKYYWVLLQNKNTRTRCTNQRTFGNSHCAAVHVYVRRRTVFEQTQISPSLSRNKKQ